MSSDDNHETSTDVHSVPVRVLTWNVWWRFGPWEQRQPAIIATLRETGADIVCLQEVWATEDGSDQASNLADALGYCFARTPAPFWEGVSFGNAILSRWPILSVETHLLPQTGNKVGPRSAVVATIDAPHGPTVVICTHLDYRFDHSADRIAQVGMIAELVLTLRGNVESSFPVIVAGDFNAVPDSDEVRALTGRTTPLAQGVVFQDCWELVGDGSGFTWSSKNEYLADSTWPNRRLDYVFVSWPRPKGLGKPESAKLIGSDPVDGVTPSDHYGVVVELRT